MAKTNTNGPEFRRVRARLGEPIDETLRQFVTDYGVADAHGELGVSRATLYHWLNALGLDYIKVWVPKGAALALIRHDKTSEVVGGEYTAAAQWVKEAFPSDEGA